MRKVLSSCLRFVPTQKLFWVLLVICSFGTFLIFHPPAVNGQTPEEPPKSGASSKEVETQVKQLFQELRDALDKSDYKTAYQKAWQALRLNPEADYLRFMRDDLGEKYLTKMQETPELAATATYLIELSKGVLKPLELSPEQIKTLATTGLDTDSIPKLLEVMNKLTWVGQRACPDLIENLGNETNERLVVNSIDCLKRMMAQAVLPVTEALNSKNHRVRQDAAIILGAIKDTRAVPELKRVMEDPQELPEVKERAATALQSITNEFPENLRPAKEYYYKLAEQYYYSHPDVMRNVYGAYIVWRWDKETDKLTAREVPDFAFHNELAEECCYDALRLDENYEPIMPLLICINLAQYNDAEVVLLDYQVRADQEQISKETLAKLQADLTPVKQGILFGGLGTCKYLYQVLARSLNDRNVPVAVSCIEAIKSCATAEDLPLTPLKMPTAEELKKVTPEERNKWLLKQAQWDQESQRKFGVPLVKALSDDDKRIRYAASEALLTIAPRRHFPGEEKVMSVIQDALGESGVRVVLMIEDNEEARSMLKKELLKLNCFPIETMTGNDGLERAKKFPAQDLIILNAKIANQVVFSVVTPLGTKKIETVFDSLRQDIRTQNIPVYLLTEPDNLEMVKSIFKEDVQAYLTIPIDRVVLEAELNKTFSSPEAQKDSKSRAEAIARSAAETLANLDLVDCIYPISETFGSLISSLEARPNEIKIPVIKALGRFGARAAIDPLSRVFHNLDNKKEVRLAACYALAEIFKLTNEPMPIDTYNVFKDGIQESDFDIQSAVAQIFGNAPLTSQQRREIFEIKRLHPK